MTRDIRNKASAEGADGGSPVFLLAAAEPSGDQLGAALIDGLRSINPNTKFIGCGGEAMAARGFRSEFRIDALGVFGPVDSFRVVPAALRMAARLKRLAEQNRPQCAVLIDSWAFSELVVNKIRAASPKTALVKYVTPQVWASRPGRADRLARKFDYAMTVLPFEPEIFHKLGLPADYVGNPIFQAAAARKGDAATFRARRNLGSRPALLILPGSRRGELRRLLPVYRGAVARLANRIHGLAVFMAPAPNVASLARELIADWPTPPVLIEAEEKHDAIAAANAALATSGTVTTELALAGAPMVVAYKIGPLAAPIVRHFLEAKYVTIMNILLDREAAPEFLQEKCRPELIADSLFALLTNEKLRNAQIAAQAEFSRRLELGDAPAGLRAARALSDYLESRERKSAEPVRP
ncbi:MAG: lipid-A-disaccharide synthase [Parvularculaceae bacterium]